jgi:hypothetical protein
MLSRLVGLGLNPSNLLVAAPLDAAKSWLFDSRRLPPLAAASATALAAAAAAVVCTCLLPSACRAGGPAAALRRCGAPPLGVRLEVRRIVIRVNRSRGHDGKHIRLGGV